MRSSREMQFLIQELRKVWMILELDEVEIARRTKALKEAYNRERNNNNDPHLG